jgi:hypothetical protein
LDKRVPEFVMKNGDKCPSIRIIDLGRLHDLAPNQVPEMIIERLIAGPECGMSVYSSTYTYDLIFSRTLLASKELAESYAPFIKLHPEAVAALFQQIGHRKYEYMYETPLYDYLIGSFFEHMLAESLLYQQTSLLI